MSVEPSPTKNSPFSFFKRSFKKDSKNPLSKKPAKKSYIIYGILAALVLGATLASSLMPLKGTIITIEPKEYIREFREEGQVLAAKDWPLYNSVDGKIAGIHIQNGDSASKGQVLMDIDTTDIVFQLNSLKAQLKSVEGQQLQTSANPHAALIRQQNLLIEQAEKDYLSQEQNLTRMKALYEAGALPLTQYEEVQHETESAQNFWEQQKAALELIYEQHEPLSGTKQFYEGQKEALRAQISQVEDRIEKAKVIAPADGLIKDCFLKQGEYAATGQLLLSVYAGTGYKVESYVLASEALSIKPVDVVEIIQDTNLEDKLLSGKVESVDPAAVERISPLGLKENRVKVAVLLQDEATMVIGSTADIRFITHREEEQIMVPKTALFPYEKGEAIWLVREGKAQIQPIVKGMENDREVIILEGLASGDQVLLDTDLAGLKEGKAVKSL